MSEPLFYPGPWEVDPGLTDEDGFCITAADPDQPNIPWRIARVIGGVGHIDDPKADYTAANASLIAATPGLYSFVADCADTTVCSCGDTITEKPGELCRHCRAVALVIEANKGGTLQ